MSTHRSSESLQFSNLGRRKVVAEFDGGRMTSDAGAMLLREVNARCGLIERLAECFTDYRDPSRVEFPVDRLLAQRIFGLCLGYEDLNDHDRLRDDPALAIAVGCADIAGDGRVRQRDRGHALASSKTLNRLELSEEETAATDRHKRIAANHDQIDGLLVDLFMDSYEEAPERIILDLDTTDDVLHGNQEGRFYHGYYRDYCYLPLYIVCGDHIVLARLRTANQDASAGSTDELNRIIPQIRARWPEVEIWIRADSGFCRDEIMTWCEAHEVKYILGLARNARLQEEIAPEMEISRQECKKTQAAARRFKSFTYRTRTSWSCERRVVAKAEYLPGFRGYNARFVVTNLDEDAYAGDEVYEELYCARGNMENRIKEQQLEMFADRTSTSKMRSNQLRLFFSVCAQMLMVRMKAWGLKGTRMASAQCGTIRMRLLKIAAVIYKSVRRFKLAVSSSYPWPSWFARVLANVRAVAHWHPPPAA